uniref:Uncharacterized protein n=1 Tax=Sphaeramia orbicularis TaxID=375764 RepID=A0A673B754_9TELE
MTKPQTTFTSLIICCMVMAATACMISPSPSILSTHGATTLQRKPLVHPSSAAANVDSASSVRRLQFNLDSDAGEWHQKAKENLTQPCQNSP